MKAVLMSIQARHNRNIESGIKKSELRKRPPKCAYPIKVYTYESGFDGRHKVVNEWICRNATEWRICMGIPAHLVKKACLSVGEIIEYSGKNYDNITEMEISDLKIYDKPKELGEFNAPCPYRKADGTRENVPCPCDKYGWDWDDSIKKAYCLRRITRPPQSWMFVEEIYDGNA